ncbi:MAG: Gfo/Idh/MocA family protein [Candidatus Limnocylindria bacterium]
MTRMRVALIGAGRMGQLHATVLAGISDSVDLVVADIDEARAAGVAADVGVTSLPVDVALAQADAMVIVSATEAHPSLIRSGLAQRIPVFCEKPLALDLAETYRLVDEIEAAGIPFQMGFQRRFDVAYREARRRVEIGALGTLYLVRMTANDHTPPPEAYIPTSGKVFRDSSIHDFDAIRWLTGEEVQNVYADGEVRGFDMFARHGDVDTVVVTLRMRNGILGVLGGGRHNPRGYDVRMELVGSSDAVIMGWSDRTPIQPLDPGASHMGTGWDSFLDRFEQAYRDELRAFVEVAAGRATSACSARDGLEAMRVAEAASRSLTERRPVGLDEIGVEGVAEGGATSAHAT